MIQKRASGQSLVWIQFGRRNGKLSAAPISNCRGCMPETPPLSQEILQTRELDLSTWPHSATRCLVLIQKRKFWLPREENGLSPNVSQAVSEHMKKQFVPPRRVGLNAKMWERLRAPILNDTRMNWTFGPRQTVGNRPFHFRVLRYRSLPCRDIGAYRYRRERGRLLFVYCAIENAKIAAKLFQDSRIFPKCLRARQFESEIARWGENDTVEF